MRKLTLLSYSAFLILVQCVPAFALSDNESPIRLVKGRHLFIDDLLISESSNLQATLHHPEKLGKPIVQGKDSPDQNGQPYATVLYDEAIHRFRMWYNACRPDDRVFVSYMESEDGIHWIRPHKDLFEIYGFGCSVTYMSPDEEPDAARRYKMIYWSGSNPDVKYYRDSRAGLCVAFSADGLEWTKYDGNPVLLTSWEDSVLGDPRGVGSIRWRSCAADIIQSTWDPCLKLHVAQVKTWTWPPDELGRVSPTGDGMGRRLASVITSPDFIHWTEPQRSFVPEPNDPSLLEFYACRSKIRGNQHVNFTCILNDDVGSGIGYTVLSTSKDGGHSWKRMKEPWLDRTSWNPEAFDHAVAWVADAITVGEKEYIYYGCYNVGHKTFNDRTLSVAFLRKDGFVSRDAFGSSPGRLATPLLVLDADRLLVNAKVWGELSLRLLDEGGAPLPGLDAQDIQPISGDSTQHEVKSKGALASLKGKPVRLEFAWRNGELYGLELQ